MSTDIDNENSKITQSFFFYFVVTTLFLDNINLKNYHSHILNKRQYDFKTSLEEVASGRRLEKKIIIIYIFDVIIIYNLFISTSFLIHNSIP